MSKDEKIYGEDRRNAILGWLKENGSPVTGGELATRTNVSRQVIVQDISLLKARSHPIIATAQGYLYMLPSNQAEQSRVIACKHSPEQTLTELNIIVDHGAIVRDVIVEHPIYGDITASLMLKNRKDVQSFIENINETGANLLSVLTDGVHLHTIEAHNKQTLDDVCDALGQEGMLL